MNAKGIALIVTFAGIAIVLNPVGNWTLVIMAVGSLIAMITAFRLDMIVNQEFYSYGLQFSPLWAHPYWITIRLIFAMALLNIITAVAFQIYKIKVISQGTYPFSLTLAE